MIVADVNLPIYLFVNGPFTSLAAEVLARDPFWVIPPCYRYELLNVIATHIRKNEFDVAEGLRVIREIARTVEVRTDPDRAEVLRLSVVSRIATYDCEYVALADELGTRVVTKDRKMLQAFPGITISLEDFAADKQARNLPQDGTSESE